MLTTPVWASAPYLGPDEWFRALAGQSRPRTKAARYPGYEIIVQHNDSKVTGGGRSVNVPKPPALAHYPVKDFSDTL